MGVVLSRCVLLLCCFAGMSLSADDRPNIVWIIADDLGPELGCYDYGGVETPNLDRLAGQGTRFTRAFSTAPVCSSSRTAFQTGQYQTTIGGHHHDTRVKKELPETTATVTTLMRQAGYFVINGHGILSAKKRKAKSHLNFVYEDSQFFDGHDWSERGENQPFFAQIQIKEPHRTFIQRERDYENAVIPPYYPDHPVTRADWGNYLASIEVLDQKVGQVLDRLDREGLVENTLVVFFGDHGRPHVRGKQWLYDGGIHTPLIVRWPGRVATGAVETRMVSLLDLMPTTLSAAAVDLPPQVTLMGKDILSPNWQGHRYLFAARDRCGEAADRIRCVRTQDFKYIRNFHPERPYLQHSSYKKLQYPVLTLMQVLHERGEWDSSLMAQTRPEEELYDLRNDPHEMHNVADDPAYSKTLIELRGQLERWVDQTNDQGVIDESTFVNMDALRAEKWRWFVKTMEKRGLGEKTTDEEYLNWWMRQLDVEPK